MESPSYMRSVVHRNAVIWRIPQFPDDIKEEKFR